ncbi:MAG: protoheme IX farnesyltransferase [Flavobacteriales bacterium]|nr:MAG: protoheme IX farnesyltransferase [Flavobacteriales bacterium]
MINAKIFTSLTKARLALSVVFSSIAGYFLAVDVVDFNELILLVVGGYSIVGASNSFNQIIEKDKDALMDRTKNRPLPAKEITTQNAFWISVFLTLIGLLCLYFINYKTAFFAAISVFLYTCVYTPLKPITPLSVFVGAIPGAIPFMLGWVAATGSFGIEPGTLFMIQFFWQFPHFWALGWMLDDDYKKAGFIMLPTGNRDKSTALQIILYIIWMMIISVFPYTGLTGDLTLSFGSTIAILTLGIIMLVLAINLYNKMDISSARKLFYSSILYLTLIQIIYLIDKFL